MTADLDHPKTVYVLEVPIVEALDTWLARLFEPDRIEETCRLLAAADEPDEGQTAQLAAAQRVIAECDDRMAKYRALIDAGTPPEVATGWIQELQARRHSAERTMAAARPVAPRLHSEDVLAMVGTMAHVVEALSEADPSVKAEIYRSLGVQATYRPTSGEVELVARPLACATERVGGGTCPPAPRRTVLDLAA